MCPSNSKCLFYAFRKIVHLPKKDLYDTNGLYKGVGHLMDIRPDLNNMLDGRRGNNGQA